MSLLDQSGVTGGGLDPYNVHALFVNMENMWTERFRNYDCLVLKVATSLIYANFVVTSEELMGNLNKLNQVDIVQHLQKSW